MKTTKTLLITVLSVTAFYYVSAAQRKESTKSEEQFPQNIQYNKLEARLNYGEQRHFLSGIIGGKRVSIKSYPYAASVIIRSNHAGTAVVLNKNWVLTSAWVVLYEDVSQVFVRGGSNLVMANGQTSWVEKVIIHPNYTTTYAADIALIKLKKPFKFNKSLKAIKIYNQDLPGVNETAVVTGFGYSESKEISAALQENAYKFRHDGWLRAAYLKVIPYEKCKTDYYYQPNTTFSDLNFCTTATTTVGPCDYDYGAPLAYKKYLIGVFSGTPACANPTYPPVYTDIKKFKDWIKETIKKN
ncbi:chymotrypsin-1-like [Lycorma delicatula]|uniref:chymotrypsin-1-like n=1 Tax=Lycorma delicatula TaxID=130591 RepID=UPI003F511486